MSTGLLKTWSARWLKTAQPSSKVHSLAKKSFTVVSMAMSTCLYFWQGRLNVYCLPTGTKPCNLRFSGADVLMNTINGGIDGIYEAKACENGRPLYMRQGSPPHGKMFAEYSCRMLAC